MRLAVLPRRVLAPAPDDGVGQRWADAGSHRCDPAPAVGRGGFIRAADCHGGASRGAMPPRTATSSAYTWIDLNRDFQRELFLARPTNVLSVKFNYWLSL